MGFGNGAVRGRERSGSRGIGRKGKEEGSVRFEGPHAGH